MYEYIKALHLIFVVTWFAGLFYIVRLFIYHTEAQVKSEDEKLILSNQFKIMEKRLWYGITWPSCLLTVVFGGYLLGQFMPITDHPWLLTKIVFLVGLFGYHHACHKMYKRLQNNDFKYSSTFLRVWNEVATLFLVAIIFLVMVREPVASIYGLGGLVIFAVVLMLAIKRYRLMRMKSIER